MVTISFHMHWLALATVISFAWLPVCIAIGNRLQREWWLNVLIISVAVFMVLFAALAISTLVGFMLVMS